MAVTSSLAELDDAIVALRVATQRPAYQQRLLAGQRFDGGVASLRLLRSVERRANHDAGPSIRRVATDLGVEHSTASRSVDALVRAGLLDKTPCPKDQRQAVLHLTELGAEVLADATTRRRQSVASVVRDWPEKDLRTAARLIERLAQGFDTEFGER